MKDGATVAAVGAWLNDKNYETDLLVTVRTKAIIAVGGVEYGTTYQPALRRQAAWKSTLAKTFRKVDFIALPTMQRVPPHIPLFGGTFISRRPFRSYTYNPSSDCRITPCSQLTTVNP